MNWRLRFLSFGLVVLWGIVALRLLFPAVYDRSTLRPDIAGILILLATLFGLWKRINSTWLIVVAGIIGAGWHLLRS